MRELNGRIAFITGAASGIGLGIAQACADAGMRLMLADIDAGALDRVRTAFAADGHHVDTQILDVADPAGWRAAADRLRESGGRLHLLCNNAGITGSGLRIDELDRREWQRIIDTNLGGLFLGVQAMLPLLKAHGEGGHVVNTASMAALLPYAGGASYAASKAAMLAFSETLKLELVSSGIGVSVLLPAQVRTQLFATSARQLGPGETSAMAERRDAARLSLEREGLDPRRVGEQVLEAVRRQRFYIFTHPQLRDTVARRFDAMLAAMGG
ncbi:MAG: SDR family oxidoreductase [Solimonas sp.]